MGSLTIHLFLFDFERVLVRGKGGRVEGERVLGIPTHCSHNDDDDCDGDDGDGGDGEEEEGDNEGVWC